MEVCGKFIEEGGIFYGSSTIWSVSCSIKRVAWL